VSVGWESVNMRVSDNKKDLIMKYIVLTAIFLSLISASTDSYAANEVSKYLSTIKVPEPMERVAPKYPIEAARQRREGWTILSFVVDEKGDVSDVLVNESSGSTDFDRASLKAVSKWKYQPAFENGKPIQQCINSVQMNFMMSKGKGEKGVSKRFNKKYKIATEALKNKNYQEVEEQLAAMKRRKNMHLSESNYMHILAANYAHEKGDKILQLNYLNRISVDTKISTKELAFSVLYQMFYLEVTLNRFQESFNTYNQLIKLDLAQPYLAKLEQVMAEVNDVIMGDKDLVIAGKLRKNNYWYSVLVRDEFSLTNIEGALHTLDIRCANKRHQYTVEDNNTWKIPSSWHNCSIYVYGEKNTSFNLIEHPLST